MGARKQPHYRIVVIEKARARNGRPVEVVGTYNPRTNPASVEFKRERVDYWVSKGAQMSDRVNKLLLQAACSGRRSRRISFAAVFPFRRTASMGALIRTHRENIRYD